MKKLPLFTLIISALAGCDKDSTEIESNDNIRLNLSIVNLVSDTEYQSNDKDLELTINLYHDTVNQQTGKTESKHIGIKSPDTFTLNVDEKSFDLIDYYSAGTVLNEEGSYHVTLPDINDAAKPLTIKLALNGKAYSIDALIPAPVIVTNYAHTAESYDPINEDILIEWRAATLPTKIEGIQTVYFRDSGFCSKDTYTFDAPTDIFSHYIVKDDINQGCENRTEEIRDISTEIILIQSDPEYSHDYVGFDNVSVSFRNRYKWHEVTSY